MGNYVLSREAESDIVAIAEESLLRWGAAAAETYILGLHDTFGMVSAFPEIGRDASHIRTGYRKIETASHSIFYRNTPNGVIIARVLHQRMDFERHL